MANPQHRAQINIADAELNQIFVEGTEEPRYKIDSKEGFVGSGSFGKILMGYDHQNEDRKVAIKIGHHKDLMLERLFRREAEILRGHQHDNLVEIYDSHVSKSGKPILVMEFLPYTLANKFYVEDFDLEKAIGCIEPVCNAVDFLHEKGVVHRNIKPGNILISEDGAVKLSDLGHAGVSGTASSARGTMVYRAPEGFAQKGGKFYPASDLYSIAVVAFEALAKTSPFIGSPDRSQTLRWKQDVRYTQDRCREYGIPEELARVLVKGMHPDRNQRYQSGKEFVDALKGVKEE